MIYCDQITIGTWDFDVNVAVLEKRGDPSAIHCGRIISFELLLNEVDVLYFDHGEWLTDTDSLIDLDPEFFDAVIMARDLMISKWSNPEKIRFKTEKTDLF